MNYYRFIYKPTRQYEKILDFIERYGMNPDKLTEEEVKRIKQNMNGVEKHIEEL